MSQDGCEGSLDDQRDDLLAYAQAADIPLEETNILSDGKFVSGFSSEDRPKYRKLQEHIRVDQEFPLSRGALNNIVKRRDTSLEIAVDTDFDAELADSGRTD